MEPSSVSVVVPAFNEEAGVGEVIRGLTRALPAVEIIVVDDASTDNTAATAEAAGARVIRHEKNRGYGAALKTGTRATSRDCVLFCDADGQHSVTDVAMLIEKMGDFDATIGLRGTDSHSALARRPGKWVLVAFGNYLLGEKIRDLNCGLRIFRRDVLMRYLHLMPDGFSFSTTSTFAMIKTGQHIQFVTVKISQRIGTSCVRQVRDGFGTLMLMLRLTVLFDPLKVFLHVSGILFLLSVTSAIFDVVASKAGLGDTTVLLSIATLIIFMFGLLCDQVSAIRREEHE
jgi:glycosyltransferase involved in cell wall biosynthesis